MGYCLSDKTIPGLICLTMAGISKHNTVWIEGLHNISREEIIAPATYLFIVLSKSIVLNALVEFAMTESRWVQTRSSLTTLSARGQGSW